MLEVALLGDCLDCSPRGNADQIILVVLAVISIHGLKEPVG